MSAQPSVQAFGVRTCNQRGGDKQCEKSTRWANTKDSEIIRVQTARQVPKSLRVKAVIQRHAMLPDVHASLNSVAKVTQLICAAALAVAFWSPFSRALAFKHRASLLKCEEELIAINPWYHFKGGRIASSLYREKILSTGSLKYVPGEPVNRGADTEGVISRRGYVTQIRWGGVCHTPKPAFILSKWNLTKRSSVKHLHPLHNCYKTQSHKWEKLSNILKDIIISAG